MPCPGCGLGVHELLDRRVFGCPACSQHFGAQLPPLIQEAQGGALQHRGAWPLDRRSKLLARIQAFSQALETAEREQRFAEAQFLRQHLHRLSQEFD